MLTLRRRRDRAAVDAAPFFLMPDRISILQAVEGLLPPTHLRVVTEVADAVQVALWRLHPDGTDAASVPIRALAPLDYLATEVVEWHDKEWPAPDGSPASTEMVLAKLTEELGELAGALVKHLQGRTDKDWLSQAEGEFGDVQVVLCTLAARIAMLRLASGPPSSTGQRRTTFVSMLLARWQGVDGRGGVRHRRGSAFRVPGVTGEEAAERLAAGVRDYGFSVREVGQR